MVPVGKYGSMRVKDLTKYLKIDMCIESDVTHSSNYLGNAYITDNCSKIISGVSKLAKNSTRVDLLIL